MRLATVGLERLASRIRRLMPVRALLTSSCSDGALLCRAGAWAGSLPVMDQVKRKVFPVASQWARGWPCFCNGIAAAGRWRTTPPFPSAAMQATADHAIAVVARSRVQRRLRPTCRRSIVVCERRSAAAAVRQVDSYDREGRLSGNFSGNSLGICRAGRGAMHCAA